jgi:dynactin complex subunit
MDSNGSVSLNCALASQQILAYSQCFAANAAADGSVLNYTANVVKSRNVRNNENVFVGLIGEIFCEPSIDIETDKTGSAI